MSLCTVEVTSKVVEAEATMVEVTYRWSWCLLMVVVVVVFVMALMVVVVFVMTLMVDHWWFVLREGAKGRLQVPLVLVPYLWL